MIRLCFTNTRKKTESLDNSFMSETYVDNITVSTNCGKIAGTPNMNSNNVPNLKTPVGDVDNNWENRLDKRGDSLCGDLNMAGNYITNIPKYPISGFNADNFMLKLDGMMSMTEALNVRGNNRKH